MAKAKADPSEGWCCDGRTYTEHAHADGKCCQPKGTSIDELPEEGRKAAEKRLQEEATAGQADAEPARSS